MTAPTRGIVAAFATWVKRQNRGDLEVDVIKTTLELKEAALGDPRPGCWSRGDLATILLEAFPARVLADDNYVSVIVPSVREFLAFVARSGAWGPDGVPLPVVLRELDEIAPEVPCAMADASRRGVSGRLLEGLLSDGVELTNTAAVQRWIQDFNNRPYDERESRTGGGQFPAPFELPVISLPPRSELAEQARQSLLVGDLVRLTEWVGERRAVTQTGVLRPADARRAVLQLGFLTEEELAESERWGAFRSAHEFPRLPLLWMLATAGEFLEVSATRVRPGPGWRSWVGDDDEDVLRLWTDVLGGLLDFGTAGPSARELLVNRGLDDEFIQMLPRLYDGSPVDTSGVVAAAADFVHSQAPGTDREWQIDFARSILGRYLDDLDRLGAVRSDGEVVCFTSLGQAALRDIWLEEGIDAPLTGSFADQPASALLDASGGWSADRAAGELAAWVAARGAERAVAELLDAARTSTPRQRLQAFALIGSELADVAEPALRTALDDAILAPYAHSVLLHGGHEARDVAGIDPIWHIVDTLAATSDDAPLLSEAAWTDIPWSLELFDDMWRCTHPDTVRVLHVVGARHPDKLMAKAARKAAFKAASRHT